MIQFSVNGHSYQVQWRYRDGRKADYKGRGRRFVGVAMCGIIGVHPTKARTYVAQGSAVCAPDDMWSRPKGRRDSFIDAVQHCGLLRDDARELLEMFNGVWPEPVRRSSKLPPEEKQARWLAGAAVRAQRADGSYVRKPKASKSGGAG